MGTQVLAACMAAFGWLVTPISWGLIGFIWLYNLIWLVVIDLSKIAIYRQFDEQETELVVWETWFRPLDPQTRAARQISRAKIVGVCWS